MRTGVMAAEKIYKYHNPVFGVWYDDSELSNWLSVDPLSDERSWVSPYSYVQNSPVMKVDPSGALDDDFYFDQDGKLLRYVDNDKPDRVFIAKDNVNVDKNDPDMVPEPDYEQFDMSSAEIEQKMGENGYRKVTGKVEVENEQYETSVSLGKFGSRTVINGTEITKGIDDKYVKNGQVPVGRENRDYLDLKPSSLGFQNYTHEIYREDVVYGVNNKRKSFVGWYLDNCVSTDARVKIEINVNW
ncbi:MAG: hypothetical protein U9Q98_04815 [Bacteroidota bacterium]|nr:hypothetical protein [Bacteroidota bacterium]